MKNTTNKIEELLDNSPHLDDLDGDGWADIRKALKQTKEQAIEEYKKELVEKLGDITTTVITEYSEDIEVVFPEEMLRILKDY